MYEPTNRFTLDDDAALYDDCALAADAAVLADEALELGVIQS